MSQPNFMEKLLDGVAVEWKPLGEVLVRTKGTKITAGQMKKLHKDGAPLKIFAGGKTIAFVDFEDIPAKDVNREPSIIVKSRGFIEFDYYDKPFSHKNEMWSYHSKNEDVNIKYVYYFLKLNEPYFQNLGSKMQMPQISTPDTDKYQIPIPPLEIQAEIVRILDTFTALTAELTAELTARKKQYTYYRDQLLSFPELVEGNDTQVEWKPLGEEFPFIRNGFVGTVTPFFTEEKHGVRYLQGTNIHNGVISDNAIYHITKEFHQKHIRTELKADDIIMVQSGHVGESAVVGEKYKGANCHALIVT